jgi:voltage-gated potassium channel
MTQERWQRISEWPLTVAAALFLAAYAWEVIGNLTGSQGTLAEVIMAATWAVFLADYVANFALAPQSWRWFRTHILDLLIVVLPLLRPLRLLRLVTLLSILQRTAGSAFHGRVVSMRPELPCSSCSSLRLLSWTPNDPHRGQTSRPSRTPFGGLSSP